MIRPCNPTVDSECTLIIRISDLQPPLLLVWPVTVRPTSRPLPGCSCSPSPPDRDHNRLLSCCQINALECKEEIGDPVRPPLRRCRQPPVRATSVRAAVAGGAIGCGSAGEPARARIDIFRRAALLMPPPFPLPLPLSHDTPSNSLPVRPTVCDGLRPRDQSSVYGPRALPLIAADHVRLLCSCACDP